MPKTYNTHNNIVIDLFMANIEVMGFFPTVVDVKTPSWVNFAEWRGKCLFNFEFRDLKWGGESVALTIGM